MLVAAMALALAAEAVSFSHPCHPVSIATMHKVHGKAHKTPPPKKAPPHVVDKPRPTPGTEYLRRPPIPTRPMPSPYHVYPNPYLTWFYVAAFAHRPRAKVVEYVPVYTVVTNTTVVVTTNVMYTTTL